MTVRTAWLALATVVIACLPATPLAGKPGTAPIEVEFVVPQGVKTGDEVETVLGFRALEDVRQLEVKVSAYKGLELLSEPAEAVFTDVRKGTAPQLTVRIRLTAPDWGALAVNFTTRTATRTAGGAIAIVYGEVK